MAGRRRLVRWRARFAAPAALFGVLAAGGCREATFGSCTTTRPVIVYVTPGTVAVAPGDTAFFKAFATGDLPGDGRCGSGGPPVSRAVRWSIDNATLATLSSPTDTTVIVTGVAPGSTVLVATSAGSVTAAAAALLKVELPAGARVSRLDSLTLPGP